MLIKVKIQLNVRINIFSLNNFDSRNFEYIEIEYINFIDYRSS